MVGGGQGVDDPARQGCRRRSFSVTPKGDVVNEGDEILPLQGSTLHSSFTSHRTPAPSNLFAFLATYLSDVHLLAVV